MKQKGLRIKGMTIVAEDHERRVKSLETACVVDRKDVDDLLKRVAGLQTTEGILLRIEERLEAVEKRGTESHILDAIENHKAHIKKLSARLEELENLLRHSKLLERVQEYFRLIDERNKYMSDATSEQFKEPQK